MRSETMEIPTERWQHPETDPLIEAVADGAFEIRTPIRSTRRRFETQSSGWRPPGRP